MSFSFSKLFGRKTAQDGLVQSQREAIADLLHYCLYADNHIALAETKTLEATFDVMNWDPAVSFQTYEARSISLARAAKENAESRKIFFETVRARLDTKHSRKLALDVCKLLFTSDGLQSANERTVLSSIEEILA
jgi:hypothetical protein